MTAAPGAAGVGDDGAAAGAAPDHWQAERYAAHARFVAELAGPLLALLAPQPGERVLDLGCGDGVIGLDLMHLGCTVVGIDASADMVRAARARGLDARVADARALPFEGAFDAVLSNAVLHWVKHDPDAAIAGVARALRPGGRFAAELGGHGNVAAIVTALSGALLRRGIDPAAALPWSFPTIAAYRRRLLAAGFEVATIVLEPRPTPLPTGIEGWLATFAAPILEHLAPAGRAAFLAEVEAALAPALRDEEGRWTADYVRLRFAARLRHRAPDDGPDRLDCGQEPAPLA